MVKSLAKKIFLARPNTYSGSIVLNLLAYQWFRIIFFYFRRILRTPKKLNPQYSEYFYKLKQDGVVAIPNFFSISDYKKIREEFEKLSSQFSDDHSEISLPHVKRMNIRDQRVSEFFRNKFLNNQTVKEVARSYLNRDYHLPLSVYLTKIFLNKEELYLPQNGGTNNLHFDAPLRVYKAFYYVSDTTKKNAAFYYCLGSQKRNSLKRWLFEYILSVRYALNKWNPDTQGEYLQNEPWVKITSQEIRKHGLEEKAMEVKGNTLVLADVGGFHRRGEFLDAGVRETVEINFREADTLHNDLFPIERRIKNLLRPASKPASVS